MNDRYSAEALIQALTGGHLPQHLDILQFDREIGWRFISAADFSTGGGGSGPDGELLPEDLPLHAETHEDGGDDEINVEGLSGLLADPQTPLAHTHTASEITDFEDAWEVEFEEDVDRIVVDETWAVVADESFNVTLSE